MIRPETKTVTRTVAVPKTKVIKQEPQPTLPNQQDDKLKR